MLKSGDVLDNFHIFDSLGNGAFGYVFKAKDSLNNGDQVAVKVFDKANGSDEKLRFDQENAILHKLKRHDYIVYPHSGVISTSEIYYAMELADGNLYEYMVSNYNAISVDEKLELFLNVCKGIDHAHSKGIIHRDLWWNNILVLLAKTGVIPKITDFGRAKDMSIPVDISTIPMTIWGAIYVYPPEIAFMIWENPTTENYMLSDIYALGIILYLILTSIRPFNFSMTILSDIKNFIFANSVQFNTLTSTEKNDLYDEWLKLTNIKGMDYYQHLQVPLKDPRQQQKINSIIKRASSIDHHNRFSTVADMIVEVESLL